MHPRIDKRMWREDIEGSLAYSDMLAECGIISKRTGIKSPKVARLADEIAKGQTEIADSFEDIHSFVILTDESAMRAAPAHRKAETTGWRSILG